MTFENASDILKQKREVITVYNYSKLLGTMREKGITQKVLAEKIGVSETTFNQKLKNNSEFKQSEMYSILNYLELNLNDVTEYFFVK